MLTTITRSTHTRTLPLKSYESATPLAVRNTFVSVVAIAAIAAACIILELPMIALSSVVISAASFSLALAVCTIPTQFWLMPTAGSLSAYSIFFPVFSAPHLPCPSSPPSRFSYHNSSQLSHKPPPQSNNYRIRVGGGHALSPRGIR